MRTSNWWNRSYYKLDDQLVYVTQEEADALKALCDLPAGTPTCSSTGEDVSGPPWNCWREHGHSGAHVSAKDVLCAVWTDDVVQPERPHDFV